MGIAASMEIAASGMSAQRRRLEIIASNLANAQTTRTADGGPYMKKLVVFRSAGLESKGGSIFADELRRELRIVKVVGVVGDQRPPRKVFDPSHPDADATGYVLLPNINVVEEMVNMIGAARSYEANLEVLKTVKRMATAALGLATA